MVCESLLTNVIAFEDATVPREELKQAVERDGGTVIGRGVVFQRSDRSQAYPGSPLSQTCYYSPSRG